MGDEPALQSQQSTNDQQAEQHDNEKQSKDQQRDDQKKKDKDQKREKDQKKDKDKKDKDKDQKQKVMLCHATGAHKYVVIEVSPQGALKGHVGHQNGKDIIPPFEYKDHKQSMHFAGQNWDAKGIAIYENDCREKKPDKEPPTVKVFVKDCLVKGKDGSVDLDISLGNLKEGAKYWVTVKRGDNVVATKSVHASSTHAYIKIPVSHAGDYMVMVEGKKGASASTSATVKWCKPTPPPKEPPTVQAWAKDCITPESDDSTKLFIKLGNLHKDGKYTVEVKMGGDTVATEVVHADGTWAVVHVWVGEPGDYLVKVSSKKASAKTWVTVEACEMPLDIPICHATGPNESDPFELMSLPPLEVLYGHVGPEHQAGRDIIPPFSYEDTSHAPTLAFATAGHSEGSESSEFPGQNWDEKGQMLLRNGCVEEVPPPENPDTPDNPDEPEKKVTSTHVNPVKPVRADLGVTGAAEPVGAAGIDGPVTVLPIALLAALGGLVLVAHLVATRTREE